MGKGPEGLRALANHTQTSSARARPPGRREEDFGSQDKQLLVWQISPCQLTSGEYRLRTEKVLSVPGAGRRAEGLQTIRAEPVFSSGGPCPMRPSVMGPQVQRRHMQVREVRHSSPQW